MVIFYEELFSESPKIVYTAIGRTLRTFPPTM